MQKIDKVVAVSAFAIGWNLSALVAILIIKVVGC